MNNTINNSNIYHHNWNNPETEEKYPEFYKKIRESDAWMKHLLYLITDINIEKTFSKNDKAIAWNAWVDAKKRLIEELDEKLVAVSDVIVGQIIKNDHAHWTKQT
jgi:hypothetical protein